MDQLLPLDERTDPVSDTWLRGLIATALENHLTPLNWTISDGIACGYVTVSRLHEAASIRRAWATHLGLDHDGNGGYTGASAGLKIKLPDAISPNEHCTVCGMPFNPRDPSPTGRKRAGSGEICSSCDYAVTTASP